MPIITLESLDDPRVAAYQYVREPDLVRRQGRFIAEGRLVVDRLIDAAIGGRYTIESMLVSAATLADMRPRLDRVPDVPVFVCDTAAFTRLAGLNLHRGCLALAWRPAAPAIDDLLAAARRVVVLEAIGNPDNVGGIFRNAAAFGVDAVLLAPGCADPFYRKAIRTSMAATLLVPFAEFPRWPEGLLELRAHGFSTAALTPDTSARTLAAWAAQPAPERLALMLGNEGDGLSAAALAGADVRVRIPMAAAVDSLNVAVTSGIALSWLASEGLGLADGPPRRYTRSRTARSAQRSDPNENQSDTE